MSISEKKIDAIDTEKIKVKTDAHRRVPNNLPDLHFLSLICGIRGSGKSSVMVKLILEYDKTKSFDHIVVFSPSASRDTKYEYIMQNIKYAKAELRDEFTTDIFLQVKNDIEMRIEKYQKYERDMALWKRFTSYKGKWEDFDGEDLLTVCDEFCFEKPETEYKNGMPTTCLIFDDLQGNKDLYSHQGASARIVNNFFVLTRHFRTSVFYCNQSFKSMGVPKAIRQNLSWLILFSNKSPEIRKEIAMECAAIISPEEFVEYWEYATKDSRHDFLYLDISGDEGFQIRKNLNIVLSMKNSTENKICD